MMTMRMKSGAAVAVACVMLLSFGSSHEVMAFQGSRIRISSSSSSSSRSLAKTTRMDASKGPVEILQQVPASSHRRDLLFLIPKAMVATATVATLCPPDAAYAAAPAPSAARDQFTRAAAAVDDLLQTWSTDEWAATVGGGDIVRTKLGTMGGTESPLFQIEKAFNVLRDAEEYVDDAIDFQETADDFMDALFQADSLANSSNNKTGSGSQTPPAVFLEQSKAEVVRMQRAAKSLTGKMAK